MQTINKNSSSNNNNKPHYSLTNCMFIVYAWCCVLLSVVEMSLRIQIAVYTVHTNIRKQINCKQIYAIICLVYFLFVQHPFEFSHALCSRKIAWLTQIPHKRCTICSENYLPWIMMSKEMKFGTKLQIQLDGFPVWISMRLSILLMLWDGKTIEPFESFFDF